MRIVLNGVETINKGAELMLYSILQEIERSHPNSEVMLPSNNIKNGHSYVKTNLNFRGLPWDNVLKVINKTHINSVLYRFQHPIIQLTDYRKVSDVDYFMDSSGFTFSDKWHHGKLEYKLWANRLNNYAAQGTKIIFLPQAFGPIEEAGTKKLISLISDTSSLILPRDKESFNYLVKAGIDTSKIKIYPDFTSLTEGHIPYRLNYLYGKVAIIPNLRMIDKGYLDSSLYINLIKDLIGLIQSLGYGIYLLNHEGIGDEKMCYDISKNCGGIDVITGLNALEIKGLISSSYLCISSRFHGVASALNSCVPCLATSWSHKYEELYKEYDLSDCILDLKNFQNVKHKVLWYLDPQNNKLIREKLKYKKPFVQNLTRRMWDEIWNL